MRVFLGFFGAVATWTVVLLGLLSGVALALGQGFGEVLAHLPVWGGLALVLSPFPAAIAVSGPVFPRARGIDFAALAAVIGGAVTIAALTFVLVGYVGPAAVRGAPAAAGSIAEPNAMSIGELKDAARAATEEVEREAGRRGRSLDWQTPNTLVWHYVRRLSAVVQPLLFAALGLLFGYWGTRLANRELARLLYWGIGAFLVVSTYLAGENSYELIALQAAGPVFFAGFFVLIVPAILVLGMAVPTTIDLWKRRDEPLTR